VNTTQMRIGAETGTAQHRWAVPNWTSSGRAGMMYSARVHAAAGLAAYQCPTHVKTKTVCRDPRCALCRQTLWFGRDPLGRRSLLVHWPAADDGRLLLASASHSGAKPGYWQVPTLYGLRRSIPGTARRVPGSPSQSPSTTCLCLSNPATAALQACTLPNQHLHGIVTEDRPCM
jgi:hypothetical protein